MTRTKYTQEQILAVLKEAEAGPAVQDLMRKHGIGQDTFYRWKRLYGGLEREELQRVRALEEKNNRLKRVADQALHLQLLQDKLGKRS
jgi:putative transposase